MKQKRKKIKRKKWEKTQTNKRTDREIKSNGSEKG